MKNADARRVARLPFSAAFAAALLIGQAAGAADLQPRTADAYHLYVAQAQRAFEQRVHTAVPSPAPVSLRDGVLFARPAHLDGMIAVPGGLIHHWTGAAFARGVSLETVLRVSQDYSHQSAVYKEVVDSALLSHSGDTYEVRTRLRESGAGITAVLDITSTITYASPTRNSAIVTSTADEIHEVVDINTARERLLPSGRDSGYLWRADEFTYFFQTADGVYVETDTVGLSRRFPPLLAWFIRPVARRLGRKSVETNLQEFLLAVTKGAGAASR